MRGCNSPGRAVDCCKGDLRLGRQEEGQEVPATGGCSDSIISHSRTFPKGCASWATEASIGLAYRGPELGVCGSFLRGAQVHPIIYAIGIDLLIPARVTWSTMDFQSVIAWPKQVPFRRAALSEDNDRVQPALPVDLVDRPALGHGPHTSRLAARECCGLPDREPRRIRAS